MSINLVTVAALPFGGGASAWRPPERHLPPLPKPVELKSLDPEKVVVQPIADAATFKMHARNATIWRTVEGERISVSDMPEEHIKHARARCAISKPDARYLGIRADNWLEIFDEELYYRSRNS